MDCELGFEVGSVLLEGVSVDAEVITFEELNVPGGFQYHREVCLNCDCHDF